MTKINHVMDSKTIRQHVDSIKIVKKNGIGKDFTVRGEVHDISKLDKFVLSACYLGAVYSERTGNEKVRLPVKMIWQIAELVSTLQIDEEHLSQSHNKIIESAEHLLSEDGTFDKDEQRRNFCIAFDLRGKDIGSYKEQLRLALFWLVGLQ